MAMDREVSLPGWNVQHTLYGNWIGICNDRMQYLASFEMPHAVTTAVIEFGGFLTDLRNLYRAIEWAPCFNEYSSAENSWKTRIHTLYLNR